MLKREIGGSWGAGSEAWSPETGPESTSRAARATRLRLLFWSALCFAGLSINNVLLVLDKLVFPTQVDLSTWRLVTALIAVLLLLFGLIWGEE